jgi:hypothetical protein
MILLLTKWDWETRDWETQVLLLEIEETGREASTLAVLIQVVWVDSPLALVGTQATEEGH